MAVQSKTKKKRFSIDQKYVGTEPQWEGVEVTDENRQTLLAQAFQWYTYTNKGDNKVAIKELSEYLKINDRLDDLKNLSNKGCGRIPNAFGWMARMIVIGYPVTENETKRLDTALQDAFNAIGQTKTSVLSVDEAEEDTAEVTTKKKQNVQDRMREKAREAMGLVDDMFDEFVADGAKAKHKFMPINAFKASNPFPHHVMEMLGSWTAARDEFNDAHAGKDKQLKEGYVSYSKIQLRNMAKFCDTVIADMNSYAVFKKTSKTPRKRKPVSPEKQVFKFKYLKEDKGLQITSEKPTKILEAKELFMYSTKRRKVIYLVADEHAGNALMVKNNTIVGFDPSKSFVKTVRKPEQFFKDFTKASKPNSRKVVQGLKAVETKFSGRGADDYLILKVW